jgi:hypothetical protein
MTAFNVVRFRVKPGRDQEFLDAHKKVQANWAGLLHANMIKTGERTYCNHRRVVGHERARERADTDDRDARFPSGHAGGFGGRPRRHRSGVRFGGAGAQVAANVGQIESPRHGSCRTVGDHDRESTILRPRTWKVAPQAREPLVPFPNPLRNLVLGAKMQQALRASTLSPNRGRSGSHHQSRRTSRFRVLRDYGEGR